MAIINKYFFFGMLLCCCFSNNLEAQSDSSSLLTDLNQLQDSAVHKQKVEATFKGTYILNTPSIEAPGKGVLQVMIMHRFGRLSDGGYQFFGLDNALIRLGLDYGVSNRLAISIGRSSDMKTFDGSLKYRVFTQTIDNTKPFSLSLNGGVNYSTLKYTDKPYMNANYRTDYYLQGLLARKFSEDFSLQLTPTWIHYNLVSHPVDKNDVFGLGIGGRYKLTRRMSVNLEYNYLLPNQVVTDKVYNSISVGLDIETGGHVFQFILSNSRGMTPPAYMGKTYDSWSQGGIYFGFNISRVFNVRKKAATNW